MKNTIVEAVGTASTRGDDSNLVNPVEIAMANAVTAIYKEVDDVWHRDDLDETEKKSIIAGLLNDDNIRERMLSERARARAVMRFVK